MGSADLKNPLATEDAAAVSRRSSGPAVRISSPIRANPATTIVPPNIGQETQSQPLSTSRSTSGTSPGEILKVVEAATRHSPYEYEYFLTHIARYKIILDHIDRLSSGKKLTILDVGCFPYHIGMALELRGHEVFGISSMHEPLKRSNVAIQNIERGRFPFSDERFDLVLFNEVIEHLPQSPVHAIKESHRVTKRHGKLMVTTPNIARSVNKARILIGKTIMYSIDELLKHDGKGGNIYHRHNREYTMQELCRMLEVSSWRIGAKGYLISATAFRRRSRPELPWLRAGRALNHFLMYVIPAIRDTLIVVAEK